MDPEYIKRMWEQQDRVASHRQYERQQAYDYAQYAQRQHEARMAAPRQEFDIELVRQPDGSYR